VKIGGFDGLGQRDAAVGHVDAQTVDHVDAQSVGQYVDYCSSPSLLRLKTKSVIICYRRNQKDITDSQLVLENLAAV